MRVIRIAHCLPWSQHDSKSMAVHTFRHLNVALCADPRFDTFIPQSLDDVASADFVLIPRITGFHLLREQDVYHTFYLDLYRSIKNGILKVPFIFHHLDVHDKHFDGLSNFYQKHATVLMTPALRLNAYPTLARHSIYTPYATTVMPLMEKADIVAFPCTVTHAKVEEFTNGTRTEKFLRLARAMPDQEFHVFGMGWVRFAVNRFPRNVKYMGVVNDHRAYAPYKWVLDLHGDVVPPELQKSYETFHSQYTVQNWNEKLMASDRIYLSISGLAHPITDKSWLKSYVPSVINYDDAVDAISNRKWDLGLLKYDRHRFLLNNVFTGTLFNLYRALRSEMENNGSCSETILSEPKTISQDLCGEAVYGTKRLS